MRQLDLRSLTLFLSLSLTPALGQADQQPIPENACSSTDFRCLSDKRLKLDTQLLENERKLITIGIELEKINAAKAAITYYKDAAKTDPTAKNEVNLWSGTLSSYRPEAQVRDELLKLTELVTKEQQDLAKVSGQLRSTHCWQFGNTGNIGYLQQTSINLTRA